MCPTKPLKTRSFRKVEWVPAASTQGYKKPFGKNVEGLSHLRAKSYVIEVAVQSDDFENFAFLRIVRRNPMLP